MAQSDKHRLPRLAWLFGIFVVGVAGAVGFRTARNYINEQDASNYTIVYPGRPNGWRDMPHTPETLFLYQEPKTKVLLGCSVNQLVMDTNPTPNEKADDVAADLITETRENMPGWTAERMDVVNGHDVSFRLVRRAEKNHVIYTAFAVKGNTTVLVTFSARMEHTADLDRETGMFRDYLSQMKLTKADLSNL